MSHNRIYAFLLATVFLLVSSPGYADIGILPIADQQIPSGKTLAVPIPASDPGGPARTYTVSVGAPTVSSTSAVSATAAGITAAIRTGDPHFIFAVTYTDSNSMPQSGTMEFQMLREHSPIATQFIGGLAEGGYYNPTTTGTVEFQRVLAGFVIQGGDPTNTGTGGPGFTFPNEYNSDLIFSATAGQLAMANAGYANLKDPNGTNGSQFFVTLAADRALDFGYTIFGQLLRGYDTLFGIAGTAVQENMAGTEDSSPINPVDITSARVTQNDTDAVLLLSATGVCNSVITVTASSGTSGAVQTFNATAVADTMDDPPYLPIIPDRTAPNGTAKVTFQGADLQLDLLRYTGAALLPAATGETTGTSPVISYPLISNTDNMVAAQVDHYFPINPTDNSNAHMPVTRFFQIGAGAKPLRGALASIPPGRNGVLVFGVDPETPLAVFTAGDARDTAASFTSSVNWGDGTYLSGSEVTIEKDSSGLTVNRYKLLASHAYHTPGEYPIVVKIADPAGAHLLLTGVANVSPSTIAISGGDIYHTGGALKNQVVANFTDGGLAGSAADYSAAIDWGDGIVSSGSIKTLHAGFQVLGTHTYQTPNAFTVSATVSRSGSSGYSAWEWSTAHIAGVSAAQVFPPFPQAHLAQMFSPIYTDSNSVLLTASSTGGNPYAALVQGTDGFFYGTTYNFGDSNAGTVYQASTTSGSINTLHSFTGGADGGNPYAGLIQAADGNYYGTTVNGGASNFGSVFQITSSGTLTTLYSFTGGDDGRNPYSTLVQGTGGELYGTTLNGGSAGAGTIFTITTSGSLTTLYTFTGGTDGAAPVSGLIIGPDGNFYGTTSKGGASHDGTIYQLTTTGSLNTLYSFTGGNDGAHPHAGLVTGTDGNLYGATTTDGTGGAGTVFQVTTSGSLTTIHPFTGGTDGGNPYASLITGTDGNLYGATETGGTGGAGTVYQVMTTGSLDTLYSFTGGNDGGNPYAAVIQATDGNLYGTTETDGTYGAGTLYQLVTVTGTVGASGSINTIDSFSGSTPVVTGTSFQIALRCSVAVVNSGNKPVTSGSFAVYVDANGTLDGNQTAFTSDGQSTFIVADPSHPLGPGKGKTFSFRLDGSVLDTRLKLPVGFNPTGQQVIGVVTYTDPVANFDGAQTIISPESF